MAIILFKIWRLFSMFESFLFTFVFVAVLIFAVIILVAFVISIIKQKPKTGDDPNSNSAIEVAFADLAKVPEHEGIYYSINTRTVYYLRLGGHSYNMMPYISNGCYCKYVNGKIEEVVPRVRIENAIS